MDELGLKAADVARKCDVPDSTVTRWLAGSLPRNSKLAVLSKTIGLPLDDVVDLVAAERLVANAARPAQPVRRHTATERIASLEETVGDLKTLLERQNEALEHQNETLEMLSTAIISKTRQVTAPRRTR